MVYNPSGNSQNKSVEVGYVKRSRNFLLYIDGLPSARINDIALGEHEEIALITSLGEDHVEAFLLSSHIPRPGTMFYLQQQGFSMVAADRLLGRVLNPLGEPIDGLGPLKGPKKLIQLDTPAWGVSKRVRINAQFITGFTMIDSMLPIGCGQRELILGEPRSGKAIFLADIILNQKYKKPAPVCIYTAIGKSEVEIKHFHNMLIDLKGMDHTIILAALSYEPAPIIAIAPSIALSLAEQFRDQGKDVLVILDDMDKHAKYLREMSLLSERLPGRDSYPGDIFFQQARLTERAGYFSVPSHSKPVSITLLPTIETNIENFTGLIPTNIMASTDGHILFTASLRLAGHFPAVHFERSVTRVGKQTQSKLIQDLSERLRMLLAEYAEMVEYSRFGSPINSSALEKGKLLIELLNQKQHEFIDQPVQIMYLSLLFTRFFLGKDVTFIRKNRAALLKLFSQEQRFIQLGKKIPTVELDTFTAELDEDATLQIIIKACNN